MNVIEGDTGLIIMDPLVSSEVAAAALELYYRHRPRRPVVAVIYTHSHVDHFGGVKGVVDTSNPFGGDPGEPPARTVVGSSNPFGDDAGGVNEPTNPFDATSQAPGTLVPYTPAQAGGSNTPPSSTNPFDDDVKAPASSNPFD